VNLAVRAWSHHDQVLSARIHHDQGHASRAVRLDEAGDVDPFGGERRARLAPHVVRADGPDERHRGPEPCRGRRLVPTLAAGVARHVAPGHRLAGHGQPLGRDHEIDVHGPNH
jgi:hypothetical protein